MLNGRLYRAAAFVPLLFALAVVAFSLSARPRPFTAATLAPDAFQGQRAFTEMKALAASFPDRRPGSAGDDALARQIARALEGLGGTAGGGFSVQRHHFSAQTIDGERQLTTIVAQRPGSTSARPIVILAHRDAALHGAQAELSGTAALLELARVFAARETRRTIILVSTSGGSGGSAGAADFAATARGPLDAALALGDIAAAHERRPSVVPYSNGYGSAPLQLQRTVADAITHEAGSNPGAPSALGQLAHLAFPFAIGEQGALQARDVPAVLVQASGERGPSARERVSAERLEGFGRGVLSAIDALDAAPDVPAGPHTDLQLQRKTLSAWAVRLIVAALLLGPLVAAADALARLRRRRAPVARWTLWTLTCALPFFACALFVFLLGWLGILAAAPPAPVSPRALPVDGSAAAAVIAVVIVLALAWLEWRALLRRLSWSARPDPEVAGLSMLLVLLAVAFVVWLLDPFTALLLVPALHLWLILASPELRPRALGALSLVALGLAPVVLLVAFYAHQLGLGPGEVLWTAVLLLAGGHVGIAGAALWSIALGCAAAAVMLALSRREALAGPRGDELEITIRGPMSYAGPGSLGGTESALRR
jgi:hypothetical protein